MSPSETVGAIDPGEDLSLGRALGFVLRALGWVAVLFGSLRIPWVQEHLMVPFAGVQEAVGCALLGAPRGAVIVNQSCTGSDAMALAVGAILAFPAPWRRRLIGALTGLLVISLVNSIRIATLALTVSQRELFQFLHLTAWPAALIVVAAGYVFVWMQWTLRIPGAGLRAAMRRMLGENGRTLRFVGLTMLLVAIYYWASRWFMHSDWLLRIAYWATAIGGAVMGLFGVESEITGNYIATEYGRWLVTQECVATPLVAVYLAAVLSAPLAPVRRALAALAALPLFILLGSARLLVLALPIAAVGSHMIAIHAFYQLVAAVVVVLVLAARRGRLHAGLAIFGGALFGAASGWISYPWVTGTIARFAPETLAETINPQGALAILPGYQLGLWVALVFALKAAARRRPLWLGGLVLILFQIALTASLIALGVNVLAGLPVIVIRMISLVAPLALVAWLLGPGVGDSEREPVNYRRFWADVGENFPDLGGAESTTTYREDEQRLFDDHLSPSEGQKIFKTDLWDEAKNTRILQRASERGARSYGIDISPPIAIEARRGFTARNLVLEGTVSDVRAIPFRDGTFDAVYSMGTVEHFDETGQALREIFRVLRPGGRGVIGVPNRLDPFLRPLMVAVLYRLGLYGYGFEKSYSRRRFREMLEAAGFQVEEETAILFIPGWLRILDLALHSWAPPLTVLTRPFVRLFRALSRRFPGLRRHGYLLATVVTRPEQPG